VITRYGAPCLNCARRFPPVECVVPVGEPSAVASFDSQVLTLDLAAGLTAIPNHAAGVIIGRDRQSRSRARSRTPAGTTRAGQSEHVQRGLPQTSTEVVHLYTGAKAEPEEHQVQDLIDKWTKRLILDGRGDPAMLRPFGGILAEITSLNGSWMPSTLRNAELLHFCKCA